MSSDINLFLQSRVEFFRRYRSERNTHAFLENENRMIGLLSTERGASLLRSIMAPPTTVTATFFDPVIVAPNDSQINASFQSVTTVPEGSCPICQDEFEDGDTIIRLRNCGHHFHRDCARSWYRMSVYCPTCRNDIRTSTT